MTDLLAESAVGADDISFSFGENNFSQGAPLWINFQEIVNKTEGCFIVLCHLLEFIKSLT